jgi:hypothetical protein
MLVRRNKLFIESQKACYNTFQELIKSQDVINQIIGHIFRTIMCKVEDTYAGKID